jgi:hypothetical protein
MYRLTRTTVTLFVAVSAITSLADATIETFDFSGAIQNVYGHSHARTSTSFDKGTEFKGSYWFDTEKLKTVENSLFRGKSPFVYNLFLGDEDAFGMQVTIGDVTFTSGSRQDARIISYSNGKKESFRVYAYGDRVNPGAMEYITLSFTGKNGALGLESDPLLLGGVNLDDKKVSATMTYLCYDDTNKRHNDDFSRCGQNGFSCAYAGGALGSFAYVGGGSHAPEPGTITILVLGGSAILFRRARKKHVTA